MLDYTDFEVWYVKTRQDEIRRQAAMYRATPRTTGPRPQQRHHWLQRLSARLAAWGLRVPAWPTTRLIPAVVRVARQKHGGSNL